MRCIYLFLFTFPSFVKIAAQIKVEDLLHLSRGYYTSLQKFSVIVETKFKNAIIIDTHFRKETHFIDRTRDIKFFKGKENAFARVGSKEYDINYNNTFQQFDNKRFSPYTQEYSHMPFIETKTFFNEIEAEFFLKESKLTGSDSTFFLNYSNRIYTNKSIEFRKTDYSIRSITEIIYDQLNKGFQFKQIVFGPVHELAQSEQDEIDNMLALIKNASNKVVFVREEKEEKPQSIDRLLLERYLKPLKNERIENKTVFLDFFYQGCYPCVKSYPYVNDLYKNKKPDVVVIGVDRLLQDSITIDRYIEKYNLQYPILTGEQALLLANFFKIHGDPTFIVIAPNGKIVEHKLGFTKGSFKSFAKTLTK